MARVLVVSETDPNNHYLDEEVAPVHIESQHSSEQFLARLAWAIYDAADVPKRERVAADEPRMVAAGSH